MEESKAIKKYTSWINAEGIDPKLKRELHHMISQPTEIEDSFNGDLTFGTSGLHAKMGPGTAHLNIYTVAAAARAFALYLNEQDDEACSAVLAYDSRNNSKEFAEVAAIVMAECDVKVLLADGIHPVPMLSNAIRAFGTTGGAMITACCEPAEYNGFKVYGSDGGQLMPEQLSYIKAKTRDASEMFIFLRNARTLDQLVDAGSIEYVGDKVEHLYNGMLQKYFTSSMVSKAAKDNLRIVYSPLNGSGSVPVRKILNTLGFHNVFSVPGQEYVTGKFSGVKSPDPAKDETFHRAIKFAELVWADIILLTDPDSDRLGVAIREGCEYKILTSNQIGIMLMEYVLASKHALGALDIKSFCTTSITSSKLSRAICARYGVDLYEMPSGSMHSAKVIRERQDQYNEQFLFGFEEGNGFMFGTGVREKDAIVAAVMIAEMAAASKSKGVGLFDQLDAIEGLYGHIAEERLLFELPKTEESTINVSTVMDHFRDLNGKLGKDGSDLGWLDIKQFIDYLPDENTLVYMLGSMDYIALKVSETDNKLMAYFGFYGTKSAVDSRINRISNLLVEEIDLLISGK